MNLLEIMFIDECYCHWIAVNYPTKDSFREQDIILLKYIWFVNEGKCLMEICAWKILEENAILMDLFSLCNNI